MASSLPATADAVLRHAVEAGPGLPGVAAVITDRHGTIRQGAAGKRAIGQDADMTADPASLPGFEAPETAACQDLRQMAA